MADYTEPFIGAIILNIYQAILSAARFIERHPKQFSFGAMCIPDLKDRWSVGCALGWVGAFMRRTGMVGCVVVHDLAIHSDTHDAETEFYVRMDHLTATFTNRCKWDPIFNGRTGSFAWRKDATACAQALRLYAQKYHGMPDAVRGIFAAQEENPCQTASAI